ncbi:MAG: 8-amino-7-oxononanoate synthase [Solirubrobacterales bacterium]
MTAEGPALGTRARTPLPAAATDAGRLEAIREAGLHRRMRSVGSATGPRASVDGAEVLLLCSNNYLGLAEHPDVRSAAAQAALRWGAGTGSSRLVAGNLEPHEGLERELADFHCREAALLFGSGYLANTGLIAALAPRGSVVYSDELNHASIIDGCRLAGAAKFVYRHRDLEHLAWALERSAGGAGLIVTDGLFSMDGDEAQLRWLVELARKHGARLLVDDAHAVGVLGPGGRGTAAAAGLASEVDVIVGTLGKSLGSYGAYAICGETTRELLVNSARTLIFSTGLPPASVAAARRALELLRSESNSLPERVLENAKLMRTALEAHGLSVGGGTAQIIPVRIGDPERAVAASNRLLEQGIYAQAIRPPTVPDGTSRLRLTVMATHRESELVAAAERIAAVVEAVGADGVWSLDPPEPEALGSAEAGAVGSGKARAVGPPEPGGEISVRRRGEGVAVPEDEERKPADSMPPLGT